VLIAAIAAAPSLAAAQRRPGDIVAGRTLAEASALAGQAPDIDAAAGILVTADGRVLWSRNATQRRAMASTTKMMTALVVLERAKPSDLVTVPKEAAAVAQNDVNLSPGERLTVTQLLEAMLVASANDAAYALARHVGGSVDRFVVMMNDKASALGLRDTHYRNPHGLDLPGHLSSAADLVSLGRYAMQDPEFRRIVALRAVNIPGPKGERRVFETTDELLKSYPGMEGIKTGMTDDAGYCLVSAARRGGVELFGVILGTPNDQARFVQSRRLLDWGFAHYRPIPVIDKGTRVGTVPVHDWLDRDIVARVRDGTASVLFDLGGDVRRRYELRPSVAAPVRAGQVVGMVTAYQGSSVLATEAVVSAEDMPAPGFWERIRIWGVRTWRAAFGPHEARTAIVTATD
jgi:D-alanyl-D-alanine carboxypeptidase (penicillin-binding protein 5/6)